MLVSFMKLAIAIALGLMNGFSVCAYSANSVFVNVPLRAKYRNIIWTQCCKLEDAVSRSST